MSEDILKGKTLGFRDSLHWQVKRVEKHFQEDLTTTARGHLKRSIVEKVRIIDSELPEYLEIEREDNTLAEVRAVLVANLMSEFPLNMGVIIAKEINWRVVKLSTSLPFPCLITQLCREAHVPILAGKDVETYATNKYELEKSKYESRYDLKLHKTIPEVFDVAQAHVVVK
ncbi:hypothetical protein HAX54_047913 [Datura stramonium]|uniref:Putative plant transposon protein domain-containing protein n=1 Tax=Datura stramonium TaxID=4076 RepID=A0ABS8WIS0_DATST|nr:hypothetical protein [Datura stramonium]